MNAEHEHSASTDVEAQCSKQVSNEDHISTQKKCLHALYNTVRANDDL
jgi:hypothetical protein